jgi:hypothetical protein
VLEKLTIEVFMSVKSKLHNYDVHAIHDSL